VVEEGDAYFAKKVEYDKSKAVGNELGLLAASKNSMTNNRDAVKCFLSSYEKAQDKLAKDPELFAATYSKFTGLPLTITGPSVRVIKLGASLDLAQLQRQAKEFHKLGVIQKDVSDKVAGAWDQTLVKEVRSAM
jgi:sulfonate transport system substrate-binding protein